MVKQFGVKLNEKDKWEMDVIRNYMSKGLPNYIKITDADVFRFCLSQAIQKIENDEKM